jgi:hypothetical protein
VQTKIESLRIAEITSGRHGGMFGITIAPGKTQAYGFDGPHARALAGR